MSDDEVFAFIASAVFCAFLWCPWFFELASSTGLRRRTSVAPLVLTPFLCGIIVFIVLLLFAAKEVRTDPGYILLFLLSGAACAGVFVKLLLPLLGLHAGIDAIECRNPSAMLVVCATMLAVAVCFAGGNIGEGPTIWTTLVPAFMGLGALAALWLSIELAAHFSESITLDRDVASGAHLAGLLLAGALILARAIAGDFVSWGGTFADFLKYGWPILLLGAAAVCVQRACRPTPRKPHPPLFSHGIVPAVGHLCAASAWVLATR